MADQSDVETALAALVEAELYPQGAMAPCILDRVCRIYRGWPMAAALDADLAAGRVNITVFPEATRQRNTTRWLEEFELGTAVTPTLRIAVADRTATLTGDAGAGQIAGLLINNFSVVHRCETCDTPEVVAAILASQIRTQRIALLSGASITIPGAWLLTGRVVADQPVRRATRRQLQVFRISCWCPDPGTRDIVASTIDAALSQQAFITLPDDTRGRLRLRSSTTFDQLQNAALYRRDLVYDVEYATTITTVLPSMIFGRSTVSPIRAGTTQSLLG